MAGTPASSHGTAFNGGTITQPLTVAPAASPPLSALVINTPDNSNVGGDVMFATNADAESLWHFRSDGSIETHGGNNNYSTFKVNQDVGSPATDWIIYGRYSPTGGIGGVARGGYLKMQGVIAAPTDAALFAGDIFQWLDRTNGGAALGLKAKTADGTVVTSKYPLRQSSGALPTVVLLSGTAAQVSATQDVATVTPFTGDATNNAATCKVELSPDNVTFSTLDTISVAAALNLTGALDLSVNVVVPAGWYIKLTATHGTLGTTTYY